MRKNKNNSDLKITENNLLKLCDSKNLYKELNIKTFGDISNRQDRIDQFGTNNRNSKKFNFFKEFFASLFEPFNILLMVIGTVELFLYIFYSKDALELVSSLIVYSMVLLAGFTDFIQEYFSFKNTNKLLHLIENDVYVINSPIDFNNIDGNWINNNIVKMKDIDLTKGDIIFLNSGDIVPADCKILWCENLYVDQSSLTGEEDPIYKSKNTNNVNSIFEKENMLISETTIIDGKCIALVLMVGENTYANKILEIATDKNDETDYEVGLGKVTKLILFSILAFFPILFLISGLRTGEWVSAVIFAISMVVSLTPESLPAIISSNIKVGSKRMAANDIVLKNFKCIQNLGSTTIIATDKTGTLTTGNINVINYINANEQQDTYVLKLAYLNSFYQTNLSNQIDKAILSNKEIKINNSEYELLNIEEFDFKTRTSSILLKSSNQKIQITKGAPQEILSMCSFIKNNNKVVNITANDKDNINNKIKTLESNGLKTLLIASSDENDKITKNNLIYIGMIVFENQIKDGVKEVISMFQKYNLDLKILTGDSPLVSENVGKKIGLTNTKTITGMEFDQIKNEEKQQTVKVYGIFSKLNPLQKATVIDYLKSNKEVITYLGDGINDVPALKTADVGISVNNGSSIAKASSDIILLKKDLNILESAILDGRKIFTNAIKFIKIIVTMNFGLLMTLLISSLWLDFQSMSPIQLLIQNLIYDFMNLCFVFDNVDEDYIRKPKKWDPKSILSFAVINGIVPILISVINFLIIGYGFGLFNNINNSTGDIRSDYIKQFQSSFFLESLYTHIILTFVYRTDKYIILKSKPSKILIGFLIFFLALGFIFEYVPGLNKTFGFAPINNNYWLLVLFGYTPVTIGLGQLSKYSYIKLFKKWI